MGKDMTRVIRATHMGYKEGGGVSFSEKTKATGRGNKKTGRFTPLRSVGCEKYLRTLESHAFRN